MMQLIFLCNHVKNEKNLKSSFPEKSQKRHFFTLFPDYLEIKKFLKI